MKATTFYDDPAVIAEASRGLGEAMVGINVDRPAGAAPPRRAWLVAPPSPRVGVLALQGDFREHAARPRASSGADAVPVRRASELDRGRRPGDPRRRVERDGQALARRSGWPSRSRRAIAAGMPVYGTCAGLIMLADTVLDGDRGPADASAASTSSVRRNAFGNQNDSFETDLDVPELGDPPVHAVFIRAPVVETVGERRDGARRAGRRPRRRGRAGQPARHRRSTPRSPDDYRFHERFLDRVRAA